MCSKVRIPDGLTFPLSDEMLYIHGIIGQNVGEWASIPNSFMPIVIQGACTLATFDRDKKMGASSRE